MSATLIDIARATNTSVSTVSRVLAGGASSKRISAVTRERVTAAARELGYRPNLVARSLRTRKTLTVALLVSDIANPFFGQLASLIEQSLHRRGYSLMLCNSGEDGQREVEYLQMITAKGIDGLIFVPTLTNREELYKVVPETLPLVILDRPIAGIETSVSSDQNQAAHLLCDILERAGVKRIGLVCGPHHVNTHRRRCEIVASRFDVIGRHEGEAKPETGRQAYVMFLGMQPDAIVCTNNFLGQGVIDAMADATDPPVIGMFDEIPMMHLLPVPLVSAVQDIPRLAEGCVTALMPQLEGGARGGPVVYPARAVSNRSFQAKLAGAESAAS
jgi:LacI family transcriptional regulator